jgi:hypothetical protein
LDIGFTNTAAAVRKKYIEEFIPEALDLAFRQRDKEHRFVWTTGSWLIREFLNHADSQGRKKMEEAIAEDLITWHMLPFTFHTELVDEDLFQAGLDIGVGLNKEFGKQRIAAKMTDVPGHTRNMIRHLANRGVEFLHIGVNPTCQAPDVPPCFIWRDDEGHQIIVNYAPGYGGVAGISGMKSALCIATTADNLGAQTDEQIEHEASYIDSLYPGAELVPSTMDAFAVELRGMRDQLPVVEKEIGDSWIHGVASAPDRVAQYRALCRKRREWKERGVEVNGPAFDLMNSNLLLIPEHTWGMDVKKFLCDFKNWENPQFYQARKMNWVPKNTFNNKCKDIGQLSDKDVTEANPNFDLNDRRYEFLESSWKEQDQYVLAAIEAIPDAELKVEAIEAYRESMGGVMKPLEGESLETGTFYQRGSLGFEIAEDGRFIRLEKDGRPLIQGGGLAQLNYQTFGTEEYEDYLESYMVKKNGVRQWFADVDFAKPGLPLERGELFSSRVEKVMLIGEVIRMELSFPEKAVTQYGAPKRVELNFNTGSQEALRVDLTWKEKTLTRLPEAIWLSFNFDEQENDLQFKKMGQWIDPMHTVDNGGRLLHAVDAVTLGGRRIESHDAPLCSPYERNLLRFHNRDLDRRGGVHFNLFNNCWGTNFVMWYNRDTHFRFDIKNLCGN